MATTAHRVSRKMPIDARARERLRDAQVAEARAVAHFFAQSDRVATAASGLAEAESRLGDAAASVVATSGAERAMVLLGLDKAELRAMTSAGATKVGTTTTTSATTEDAAKE